MKTIYKKLIKICLVLSFLGIGLESCNNENNLQSMNNQPHTSKIIVTSDPSTNQQIDQTSQISPENSSIFPAIVVTNAMEGWNKNLKVDDVFYDLYIPPNYNQNSAKILPCVLVFPGWNFSRTSWVEHTKLVEYANQYKYALILPEMRKTLYESSYYPQTTLKWNQIPGGTFIKEKFIPAIAQKHNLLKKGNYNTLLGLSTGGRGVALIALENPDLFVAGASLSGDFSQENTPQDRLMTSVYGAYQSFPQRWTGRDNPQARVSEWKMPLYLAHGTADNVVPEAQSRLFYDALVRQNSSTIIVEYRSITGAGHDYNFWEGQLENVFEFIDQAQ
jgi:putative tributyrin esterase